METITNLIKDTPIPKMVKVRQNFDKTCILESDIPGIITRELDRPEIGGKIQPGQKIAITPGPRDTPALAAMRSILALLVSTRAVYVFSFRARARDVTKRKAKQYRSLALLV